MIGFEVCLSLGEEDQNGDWRRKGIYGSGRGQDVLVGGLG